MNYKHKQIGYLIIAIFLIVELWIWIGYKILVSLDYIAFILGSCVVLVPLALFYFLTVEIKEGFLHVRFGIGLIRKKFKLLDIVAVNVITNKWYYGWGIRMLENGWLYNVSGLDAVEIKMNNGKIYRIGTDESEKLQAAINGSIQV